MSDVDKDEVLVIGTVVFVGVVGVVVCVAVVVVCVAVVVVCVVSVGVGVEGEVEL